MLEGVRWQGVWGGGEQGLGSGSGGRVPHTRVITNTVLSSGAPAAAGTVTAFTVQGKDAASIMPLMMPATYAATLTRE